MDRATDCCPSRVQDWLYCCEPNSTRGFLVFGSTVTTSLNRTMPVAGGVRTLGFVRFAELLAVPDVPALAAGVFAAACAVGPVELAPPALRMMSANSSGLVR